MLRTLDQVERFLIIAIATLALVSFVLISTFTTMRADHAQVRNVGQAFFVVACVTVLLSGVLVAIWMNFSRLNHMKITRLLADANDLSDRQTRVVLRSILVGPWFDTTVLDHIHQGMKARDAEP